MNWYRFHAFNSNALYGFGSAHDAELFCDRLNVGRQVNHYAATIVPNHEVWGLGLEESPESFDIADELADEVA